MVFQNLITIIISLFVVFKWFYSANVKKRNYTFCLLILDVMDGFSIFKNHYYHDKSINRASLAIIVPMLERENRAREQH